MDILRLSRDVYGREVLEGVSFDLIPVFFGLGLAVIVLHLLWRWLLAPADDTE